MMDYEKVVSEVSKLASEIEAYNKRYGGNQTLFFSLTDKGDPYGMQTIIVGEETKIIEVCVGALLRLNADDGRPPEEIKKMFCDIFDAINAVGISCVDFDDWEDDQDE